MATVAEALWNFGRVDVIPPAGLTDSGRLHRFQEATVQRLVARGEEVAGAALLDLQASVAAHYQQGEGDLANSFDLNVTADRDGVGFEFTTNAAHAVYLTALAGLPYPSPGHPIAARQAPLLKFFWKDPPNGQPGIYQMREVFWRPRAQGDVIAAVMGDFADRFTNAILDEHTRALVEWTDELEQDVTSRSRRVSGAGGNQ